MSAVVEQPPAPARDEGYVHPSLLRAEFHRFRSRRFIQVLLAAALVGWLAAVVIGLFQFGEPDEGDLAAARAEIAQMVEQQEVWRQQCLDDAPPGEEESFCGPEITAAEFRTEDFVGTAPFDLEQSASGGAMGFGAAAAALAFLIGATWIGAEWSSRSVVALLFWVPRRMQVMGAKVTVLAVAAAALGVAAQLGWLAMAWILRIAVGTDDPLPSGFWGDLLATQGRCVLLVVFAALAGFGLANLIRNTGAALGVGFVYFAIVENAVRVMRPEWQPALLTNNAAALVAPGGLRIVDYENFTVDADGNQVFEEFVIGNLQAGIVLGVVAAVVIGLGVLLFQRRDVH
ncbi:ABC transporter permease subunit [Blastococcus sp. TF02A-30]|uniref:ABC transporter permease subunit n=1 Tax=Blastococcus sp. TF02A-30 TaxID=2250580 RepID=UPI000DE9B1FB|nr:ABC transporter permease subunit [Blastococcus sp. TF02A-30]RBY85690.1 hypothetical protein DQ241_15470 [Blastococcus sp. TF02A-30]